MTWEKKDLFIFLSFFLYLRSSFYFYYLFFFFYLDNCQVESGELSDKGIVLIALIIHAYFLLHAFLLLTLLLFFFIFTIYLFTQLPPLPAFLSSLSPPFFLFLPSPLFALWILSPFSNCPSFLYQSPLCLLSHIYYNFDCGHVCKNNFLEQMKKPTLTFNFFFHLYSNILMTSLSIPLALLNESTIDIHSELIDITVDY